MANTHVGHDGIVGDSNVFANSAALAGHVTVGNRVIVGGLSGIHQFVHLGDNCILSGGTMAVQDVPPFCMAQGDRATLAGINVLGMQRAGFSDSEIQGVKSAFKKVVRGKGLLRERLDVAQRELAACPPALTFIAFIANSERGVCSARSSHSQSEG
jgi:UDP-N-acetylglucosamine acyltransferase